MKIVRFVLTGLALAVAGLVAIGLLVPSQFRVERSERIEATPAKIYPLLADPREWKKWSAWNRRDPNMKITYSGPPSGVGAGWSWESASEGTGNMTFTAAEPGRSLDYALSFPSMGMASRGVLILAPEGAATRVSWTNEGDVGKNPLYRLVVPFMDAMVGPDFSAGLANLKTLVEKNG